MDRKFSFYVPEKKRLKPGKRKSKGFSQPRKVEDYWNFYKKSLYITRPSGRLPAWLLPLLAFILIMALVFWGAPTAINRIKLALKIAGNQDPEEVSILYGEDTWAIAKPVADVFAQDDLKASRLTQGLYNEPVRILSRDCTEGFVLVRLSDGLEGYMRISDLVDSRDSIEPDAFLYKLVISAPSKRIMSHTSHGTMLVEVLMGTVLFADYHGNGVSRVMLPEGGSGWISDDGVIILGPLEKVSVPEDGARYFCNTAMAFNQITVLENGQSIRGISTVGIARQAAAVNGVTLPRTLAGISESGEKINLDKDEETGLVMLEQILSGDLVVFSGSQETGEPVGLAICIGQGMILYARPGQSAIKLLDLSQNMDLWEKILMVRRIFPG